MILPWGVSSAAWIARPGATCAMLAEIRPSRKDRASSPETLTTPRFGKPTAFIPPAMRCSRPSLELGERLT